MLTGKRLAALGAGAVAAAFAGVLALAPAASAEANPPGCGKGYFCAYSGANQSGGSSSRSRATGPATWLSAPSSTTESSTRAPTMST